MKSFISRINQNIILRNVILAVCAIIVFAFSVTILLNIFTRHGSHKEVPEFKGMVMEDAINAARKASLELEINDSVYFPTYEGGVILDQIPVAGTQVKAGRRIFVTVNSFHQKKVIVPYVTGFSLRQAKNNIEVAGLEIEKLVYREDIAADYILEEFVDGKLITRGSNVEIEMGSGVTLTVGRGDKSTQAVPKVVGFPLQEAKSRLWEVGLNIGKIEKDANINPLNIRDARVYFQSPAQGASVGLGASVAIKLSLDENKVYRGNSSSDRNAKSAAQAVADSLANSTEE